MTHTNNELDPVYCLPGVDTLCLTCAGTHLCAGKEHGCGCTSADDCPTLGWCPSCLPDESVDVAPYGFFDQSIEVPA
ncbi:hypothetical protein [Microcoleus sp. FACHB-68]|uniref:hypothetical protein n=1 Tax=Microcoleus sp. FACHB-68 TaxID=2692826 RepID=UPI001686E55E|nr:hypothetical protein [Microcoleus sp. FACHB-68]MBD1939105.1 hypothetical protein [Microcoleus sp. FACHB-68]